MNTESRRQWEIRQSRPGGCDLCQSDFPAWIKRQNIPQATREAALKLWNEFPRREGRPFIPDMRTLEGDFPVGQTQQLVNVPPELARAFVKWIDVLKTEPYVVQVNNATDTVIAVVWTYMLNELTPSDDIITVGPYSSYALGVVPGDAAVFAITGCLYMKSYAIAIVYEGMPEYVLPNTSIEDINAYELSKFGKVDFCGDKWEIYVP